MMFQTQGQESHMKWGYIKESQLFSQIPILVDVALLTHKNNLTSQYEGNSSKSHRRRGAASSTHRKVIPIILRYSGLM